MRRPYFTKKTGDPEPLTTKVSRRVRFEETDPLGIVWHGRYPGYFEDARVALGERYGIGYLDLFNKGVIAPIKKMHLDYYRPLRLMENFTIEAILHWSDATRINYEFIIRDCEDIVATTGYSVQVLLDRNNELLLFPPPFFRDFCEKWRRGELS